MALISTYTMIRSLSLFHIILAVLLLRNPRLIADQSLVHLFSEAMQLPTPREFLKPSAATAFIAVLFAFLGISDLAAFSLPEEMVDLHWSTQTPVRLLFLFGITGYSYAFKEGGMMASSGRKYTKNAGDHLKNSIVFAWGFLELAIWFWVFISLRDERRQRAIKLLKKQQAEQARM